MLQYHYDKVATVEEGVRRLLTIRDVEIPEFTLLRTPEGEYTDVLVLDGERIPLLYKRYEPRMNQIHNYGVAKREDNCILNTISFIDKRVSLDSLIYLELDVAEYVLGSPIEKITAFINGNACNILAKCESGAVAGLELGATLAEGAVAQFNHRLITKHGIATDRTVNNVAEQSGVYLFSDEDPRPTVFDDGEYYLYGLSVEDSYEAVYINAIINGKISKDELIATDLHLKELIRAVHKSSESGKSVFIGDGRCGK